MTRPSLRSIVAWNVAYQVGAQVVALGVGLAMAVLLSRHLGVEGYGAFNYLFAFVYFCLAANDLGVGTIVIRELSQRPDRAAEIIGSMRWFRLLVSLATTVAAWAIIALLHLPGDLSRSLALFVLILPLDALKLPGAMFSSTLHFEYTSLVEVVTRLSGLALVVIGIRAGVGLLGITMALLLAEAAGVLTLNVLARRLVRPGWRMDRRIWPSVLRSSLPLGLAALLTATVNRVDFFMIERMADLGQVGLYGAAYKVTSLVERGPQIVMGILYPLLAAYAHSDPRRLRSLYRRSLGLFTAAAVPIALVVTWLAPLIVRLMFGAAFEDAARALRVLIWATAFLYVALPGGSVLISLKAERVNLATLVVATAVNVALNWLWIPTMGYVGAALSTAVTFAVILVVTVVAVEVRLGQARATVTVGAEGVELPATTAKETR